LEKIQTPVRKNVAFVSGGVFNCLIRTTVRIPSPRLYSSKRKQASTMSALTFNTGFNSTASKSIVNQSLQANPSGRLTRRGRLARTIVVLSLAVVMVSGFAATSGANTAGSTSAEPSYSIVVVAPGETLWSVAAAYASGDVQGLINEIREVNNLKGYDLQAGQRLRVPN
jgi:LysM repeat protein